MHTLTNTHTNAHRLMHINDMSTNICSYNLSTLALMLHKQAYKYTHTFHTHTHTHTHAPHTQTVPHTHTPITHILVVHTIAISSPLFSFYSLCVSLCLPRSNSLHPRNSLHTNIHTHRQTNTRVLTRSQTLPRRKMQNENIALMSLSCQLTLT